MLILLTSFGYTFGVPKAASCVKDLKQFPSPSRELCSSTDGTSKRLQDDILNRPVYVTALQDALDKIVKFHQDYTKKSTEIQQDNAISSSASAAEAKESVNEDIVNDDDSDEEEDEVTVFAFGCERGCHRSVAFVERLHTMLTSAGIETRLLHRDIGRRKERMRKERAIRNDRKAKHERGQEQDGY